MIVGYTFDGKSLPATPYAKQVEESLGHCEGILDGIEVNVGTNAITIDEGRMLIKGRQFEVIGSETVNVENVDSGNLYAVLIVEIDLSKESSASVFDQVAFKYLSSAIDYPSLTQQDINSGDANDLIYQFELARFRIGTNGISNYQDERTFLNFNSLYNQILTKVQNAIDSIEDGSAFISKIEASYSTDEVNTGKRWIDGKPIYRKTYRGDSIPNRLLDINITDLNIDEIFFDLNKSYLHWEINNNPKRWAPITQTAVTREGSTPEPQVAYYQSEVWVSNSKNHLYLNLGRRMNADKWVITIEYTKTTD